MSTFRNAVLILLAASTYALAQSPGKSEMECSDYRFIARKADKLLQKENGVRLELEEPAAALTRLNRPSNKILWNSNIKDKCLVSIVVEPIDAENEQTTQVTAALLVSVAGVDNYDEGVRMATLLKEAQSADGLPRMVQLKNGIKLYRLKPEKEAAKYRISL